MYASNSSSSRKHEKKPKELFHKLIGDMVPVYSQILETYGSNVAAQLVADGFLSSSPDQLPQSPKASKMGKKHHHNFYLWPNRASDGRVEIAYQIDDTSSFASSKKDRALLEKALDDLAEQSGVLRFFHTKTTTPRLFLTQRILHDYDFPAWSYVGWHGNDVQPLFLGAEVLHVFPVGSVHHMFLHALGFWHTINRYDRDDYVTIEWANVIPVLRLFFQKRILDDTLGYLYDYESVMHFAKDDYSADGGTVVTPKNTTVSEDDIGRYVGASAGDLIQVRLLYQCRSGPRTYANYLDHPCTADCPCWKGASSCRGQDDACQGDLICSSKSNQCIQPLPTLPTPARTASLLAASTNMANHGQCIISSFSLVVGGALLIVFYVWSYRSSNIRQAYQELD